MKRLLLSLALMLLGALGSLSEQAQAQGGPVCAGCTAGVAQFNTPFTVTGPNGLPSILDLLESGPAPAEPEDVRTARPHEASCCPEGSSAVERRHGARAPALTIRRPRR